MRPILAALFLSASPAIAAAQMCRGGMPSDMSPVRVAGTFDNAPNDRRYGVSIAYVSRAFASAAISNVWSKVHRPAAASTWYGAEAGYTFQPRSRVDLCPLATFQAHVGPEVEYQSGSGFTQTSSSGRRSAGLGLAIGGRVNEDEDVDVVPFANALYLVSRYQWKSEESGIELTGHRTHRHGAATVGVGIVLKNAVTIVPYMSQLVDSEDFGVEKTHGVRVVLNVGRGSQR